MQNDKYKDRANISFILNICKLILSFALLESGRSFALYMDTTFLLKYTDIIHVSTLTASSLVLSIFIGMIGGIVSVVGLAIGDAYGRHSYDLIKTIIAASIIITAIYTCIIFIIMIAFGHTAISYVISDQSIANTAYQYNKIMLIYCMLVTLGIIFIITSIIRGRYVAVMIYYTISIATSCCINYFLISNHYFEYMESNVTIIGMITSAILFNIVVYWMEIRKIIANHNILPLKLWYYMGFITRLGIILAILSLIENMAFLLYFEHSSFIADKTSMFVYASLIKAASLCINLILGISKGISVYLSLCIANGKMHDIKRTVNSAIFIIVMCAGLCIIFMHVFYDKFIEILTLNKATISANQYFHDAEIFFLLYILLTSIGTIFMFMLLALKPGPFYMWPGCLFHLIGIPISYYCNQHYITGHTIFIGPAISDMVFAIWFICSFFYLYNQSILQNPQFQHMEIVDQE